MTIRLYATMVALEGKAEIVGGLLAALKRDVDAEPGSLRFEPCRLADQPNHFHVEETYRDAEAFRAHIASAHGARFNSAIIELVENGRSEVVFLEPL